MTIYGLGTASTFFFLFLSVCLILFPLLAIGIDVPFLIAVMASKIGVLLLFTGGSFAIAFPLDRGDCIEGGGSASPVTFFILNASDYVAWVKVVGVAKGKDLGSEHFIVVGKSLKYNEAILSVRDTHFCVGRVDSGLIQLSQLRP